MEEGGTFFQTTSFYKYRHFGKVLPRHLHLLGSPIVCFLPSQQEHTMHFTDHSKLSADIFIKKKKRQENTIRLIKEPETTKGR